MSEETSVDLREAVRSRYAEAARAVLEPRPGVTAQSVGKFCHWLVLRQPDQGFVLWHRLGRAGLGRLLRRAVVRRR